MERGIGAEPERSTEEELGMPAGRDMVEGDLLNTVE